MLCLVGVFFDDVVGGLHVWAEEVEVVLFGECAEGFDSSSGVGVLVESWGVDTDSHDSWDDSEDGAGDSGLCGDADFVGPSSGVVVHAAHKHDDEDVFDIGGGDGAFLGDGVEAVVGEGGGGVGELLCVDAEGALVEVEIECVFDGAFDVALVFEEVSECAVAVSGAEFGIHDGLVEGWLGSGVVGDHVVDYFGSLFVGASWDEGCGDDRAGVDHRVEGAAFVVEVFEGGEGSACWFDSGEGGDDVASGGGEGLSEDEGFGDGLECEVCFLVSDDVLGAVDEGDGDAVSVGVGFGEFGDVGRDGSFVETAVAVVEGLE